MFVSGASIPLSLVLLSVWCCITKHWGFVYADDLFHSEVWRL